jgi:hypothetical protein
MLASHRRAMRDICACRTAALGGESYLCKRCQEYRYSYHSCKNRHCPKCGNDQATAWLEKQLARLLPVGYFLVTFTLPEELRAVARSNQRIVYTILMNSAAEALQKLAWDNRFAGGRLGIVAVLQTWTRDLRYHPHVHMIVTGGGLSADGSAFHRSSPNFLVPQGALRKIFRAKFADRLKKQLPDCRPPSKVWNKRWVVDLRPVGSGHSAFRYLAPYIFRIALSNKRILSLKDGIVTFQYEDAKTKRIRQQRLPAEQFISRFLQHVLPPRFRKVRYYGLFSPQRKKLLAMAQWLLPPPPPVAEPAPSETAARPVSECPKCRYPMEYLGPLPRYPYSNPFLEIRAP